MPIFTEMPPLSLYIHIPWCVRKCPYCDFNSHEAKGSVPETQYIDVLLQNLDHYLPLISGRPLISIFFGGGTPSLFSGQAIARILKGVAERFILDPHIEITLEANPGTLDEARFKDFYQAGINRLSLGIQSLENEKLLALGRIHHREDALRAIQLAQQSGFNNFNLDLMYGLPQLSPSDALRDLRLALSFNPTHLSWYQLTIEPNTFFYKHTPTLPTDDTIWDMQLAGQQLLRTQGLNQYEVSAYATTHKECVHNRNYWEFGDYLGIGAGAHSKITTQQKVLRFVQAKHPKDYFNFAQRQSQIKTLNDQDLIFEFMLNALRLTEGIPISLFTKRTGLSLQHITTTLNIAKQRGLLLDHSSRICASALGMKFLNDLITLFLHA
jgi:oxygen-independent coproporphyrinogen-3 oxidase